MPIGMDAADRVLGSVRALLPSIADTAADVDRAGAVDPEVLLALHDAGYFTMLQPARFGGLQARPDSFLTVTRELSAACASTGWLAGWLAVNSWHLALFDDRAQDEVWGADPRALVATSYGPTGRLERIAGGFRLSGRWNHCTGIGQASWLLAAALLVAPDGSAEDFLVALVPRSDYTIEPTWNGLGLRGIGADDAVVPGAGVEVPAYRTFGFVSTDQLATLPPLYRLPQPTLYSHTGTMPLQGAALRLLAGVPPGPALDPIEMARSGVELSMLQIRRNLTDLMDSVESGSGPDSDLILRSRRDQVVASERAIQAVQTVVRNPPPGFDEALAERLWRDVQTARNHVASNVDQVLSVVGRFAYGLRVDDLLW
ncbi:acyl-CoA dehydrogenase family protein [Mycolicibacterium wolinskyi]|nr:acyl-CoA dehydrogenase family protein [Mycolicibacterium wolinskyi]